MMRLRYIVLLLTVLTIVGCSDDNVKTTTSQPAPSTSECRWAQGLEVPALKSGNIVHPVVTYEQAVSDSVLTYIYEWDPKRRHIRWTAFSFDKFTCQKNWKRKDWESTEWGGDPWHDDEYLAPKMRTTYENHRGNGYDRGHMVASADRLYSSQANWATYSYSNMSPQLDSFNKEYWSQLEQLVQNWGASRKFCDKLYVVKGGTIDDDKDILEIKKSIAVPKYYFMAVMREKDGKYDAVGFLMEHSNEGYTREMSLLPYAMTIDALEVRTGIDFFHNLADDVEEAIEQTFDKSVWGMK